MQPLYPYLIIQGDREWADARSQQDAYFGARKISEEEPGEFEVLAPDGRVVGWALDGKLTVTQGVQR